MFSLCCISKTLADNKQNFQTMTFSQFQKLGESVAIPILADRILHNFKHTHKTIRFCELNSFGGYRISSSIVPLLTHRSINLKISDLPNFDLIKIECEKIKQTIKNSNLRFSAHPSEYITLSAHNEDSLNNSVLDLEQHAEIFSLLGLEESYQCPLNIHVRQEGDPQEISKTVINNIKSRLSKSVQNRLVFENNDNKNGVWTPDNLIKYFYETEGIPITFDNLHHRMLPGNFSVDDAINQCAKTWGKFNPVFHYSEGIIENNVETRKHADMPSSVPPQTDFFVNWEVELKHKCLAIFALQARLNNTCK